MATESHNERAERWSDNPKQMTDELEEWFAKATPASLPIPPEQLPARIDRETQSDYWKRFRHERRLQVEGCKEVAKGLLTSIRVLNLREKQEVLSAAIMERFAFHDGNDAFSADAVEQMRLQLLAFSEYTHGDDTSKEQRVLSKIQEAGLDICNATANQLYEVVKGNRPKTMRTIGRLKKKHCT